jgi:hypothetical protein
MPLRFEAAQLIAVPPRSGFIADGNPRSYPVHEAHVISFCQKREEHLGVAGPGDDPARADWSSTLPDTSARFGSYAMNSPSTFDERNVPSVVWYAAVVILLSLGFLYVLDQKSVVDADTTPRGFVEPQPSWPADDVSLTQAPATSTGPNRAPLVLAALILAAAVANLNLAVANVALPTIGKAFDA